MSPDKTSISQGADRRDGLDDDVADSVDQTVDRHPWVEKLTKLGWLAKGLVYTLMGVTALRIARQDSTDDHASPEGSLGQVANATAGRLLIGFLAVGLVLYFAWRILSVAVIRGHDLAAWGDRIGYAFSGLFYAVLGFTAAKAALTGLEPDDSNTVEQLSRSLLDSAGGRWLLGAVGVVTMVVGAYFGIHKGIQRSFTDDLDGVHPRPSDNEPKRVALLIAGVFGWIGRGIVTGLVGFFVARAAVRFDPDDARGFDRTLRQVAGTSTGSFLVLVCAAGLITYGLFCLASHRFRELEDNS